MNRWYGALIVLLALCVTPIWAVLVMPIFSAPLRAAGESLNASDPLQPADLIFVMNGRIGLRAHHAVRLYNRGIAPKIVISATDDVRVSTGWRPGESSADAMAFEIHRSGVPESAIEIIPGGVSSTLDEARALRRYLEMNPASRVVVATTDYHTARAGWVIRKELKGLPVEVVVAGVPDNFGLRANNWWKSAGGMRTYLSEWVKWLGTAILLLATPREG